MEFCLHMCRYCGQSVRDALWHIECRAEYLEDVVAQLVNVIAEAKLTQLLPNDIPSKILQERFRPMEEIRKARVKAEEHKDEMRKHEAARKAYLEECAKKWDEEHPEPKQD